MSIVQLVFLGAILFGFAAFTVTLLYYSIAANVAEMRSSRRPIAQEVTPARHANVHTLELTR